MGGAGGVAMAPSAMPTSPNDIILVPGNQLNNHGNSFPGQQMPTMMNPLPEETRPLPSVPPKRELQYWPWMIEKCVFSPFVENKPSQIPLCLVHNFNAKLQIDTLSSKIYFDEF